MGPPQRGCQHVVSRRREWAAESSSEAAVGRMPIALGSQLSAAALWWAGEAKGVIAFDPTEKIESGVSTILSFDASFWGRYGVRSPPRRT